MASRMFRPGMDRAEPLSSSGHRGPRVREGDGRPVVAFTHAPCHDAHHALVPVRLVQAKRHVRADFADLHQGRRVFGHVHLDLAPLRVELVEALRRAPRGLVGLGEQTADADGHVLQAGQAAFNRGPMAKPRSAADSFASDRPAVCARGLNPRPAEAGAQAPQPLVDQDAVLFRSSVTTSATVPSATRSNHCARFGSAMPLASKCPRARSARRATLMT